MISITMPTVQSTALVNLSACGVSRRVRGKTPIRDTSVRATSPVGHRRAQSSPSASVRVPRARRVRKTASVSLNVRRHVPGSTVKTDSRQTLGGEKVSSSLDTAPRASCPMGKWCARKQKQNRFARELAVILPQHTLYWETRRKNDDRNQIARRHLPPSGMNARNARFPVGHSGTLVNHCRRIFEDFFPDRALRDNPPDINLDELADEWCGTADLTGDARFRAPKRCRHSCVRFGLDSEGKVDVGQTNLLKMAVRFLKETLKGYAAIETRTPGYCTLYDPFASRCFIALTWLGFATYTEYVGACRHAASRTSRSPWVSSTWINQEMVYANLVTSQEVRECMREDNVFLSYARMVNPFDPCISAPLWKEYRGVGKAINVVCSPPRDVIDVAFFFFSKRVSNFAAFLIPETFLKREESEEARWPSQLKYFLEYVDREERLAVLPCAEIEHLYWWVVFKGRKVRSSLLGEGGSIFYGLKGGRGRGRPASVSETERKARRNAGRREKYRADQARH